MQSITQLTSWALHNPAGTNSEDIDFEACFRLFLDYETKLKITPTRIGLDGPAYAPNKVLRYDTGLKKLTVNKFKDLTAINLYSSKPDSNDFAFDWHTLFAISSSKILGMNAYVGVDTTLLPQSMSIITDIIAPLCQLVQPILGYAYLSTPNQGPFAYSTGSVHTPQYDDLTDEHKELIFTWARERELITSGKLRDLYPDMILSDIHKTCIVDNQPLPDWILSSSDHGTLRPLSDHAMHWHIPAHHYLTIRDELAEAGLLIAYSKHILPTILV